MKQAMLVLLLLLSTTNVAAQDRALFWMNKMQQALTESHFQISLVQTQREKIRTLRYHHSVINEQEVALLEHLSGPVNSIIRVDNQLIYIEPDSAPYSVFGARINEIIPSAFAQSPQQIEPHYQFVLGGRNRVAGHMAQLVRIIPQDTYRYHYQVWIELESGVPLKIEQFDQRHNLLNQILVVDLKVNNYLLPLLRPLQAESWPDAITMANQPLQLNWQLDWLPAGFKLVKTDRHQLRGVNQSVDYLAFSDGLVEFSVYIGKQGEIELPGEINTLSGLSMAAAQYQNYDVVAVGKMPVEGLTRIVNGVYFSAEETP